MEKAQCGSKSNVVHRGATAGGSGKQQRKRKGGGEPIKVVYVNNPMRVTTDAAGFRALVHELTGRHADPSKYGAAVSGESSGSPAGPRMAPSPGSTAESSDGASGSGSGAAAGACHDQDEIPEPPAAAAAACYGYACGDEEDDEDSFAPQLIDNRYSVFSPPTFLYASHDEV